MDIDDVDWEDGVLIGGFFDYMTDQEQLDDEEQKRRRKSSDETDTEEDIDDCQEPS